MIDKTIFKPIINFLKNNEIIESQKRKKIALEIWDNKNG